MNFLTSPHHNWARIKLEPLQQRTVGYPICLVNGDYKESEDDKEKKIMIWLTTDSPANKFTDKKKQQNHS